MMENEREIEKRVSRERQWGLETGMAVGFLLGAGSILGGLILILILLALDL